MVDRKNPIGWDLGGFLIALRKSQGWSQEELAKRLGVRRNHISGVEHGENDLRASRILKVLDDIGAIHIDPVDRPDYSTRDKEAARRLRDALDEWLAGES